MENVKDWLDKKGYCNSGLRSDRNHRIDLYLSDVLEEYAAEQLSIAGVGGSLPSTEDELKHLMFAAYLTGQTDANNKKEGGEGRPFCKWYEDNYGRWQ